MGRLHEYMVTEHLIEWAKANLGIIKCNGDLSDDEIRSVLRWIGMHVDTVFIDSGKAKPTLSRLGIGVMLSITLLVFPDFYSRYELSQFN